MTKAGIGPAAAALLAVALTMSTFAAARAADSPGNPGSIERGRYLVKVSGCNDCHTPGYLPANGNVPVDKWLTGDGFGWRGPWGTTYGANLRLFMQGISENEWVEVARTLRRRPPMPWFNLNAMAEDDLRAIYRFTRSLGNPCSPAPNYLPPGEEPKTPYALFRSPPKN